MRYKNMNFFGQTILDRDGRWPRRPVLAAVVAILLDLALLAPVTALALPLGREYEQVSPVYKGGYSAGAIEGVAPSGESVVFESFGVFAGAPSGGIYNLYLARRGASDWTTEALKPPATLTPTTVFHALSSTLESLWQGWPGVANTGTVETVGTEPRLFLHPVGAPETAEGFEVAGERAFKTVPTAKPLTLKVNGASDDFCDIAVESGSEEPLTVEAVGKTPGGGQYEFMRGCGGQSPSLQLIAVTNRNGPEGEPEAVNPHCLASLGFRLEGFEQLGLVNQFNAMSAGGGEIFFTANVEPSATPKCGTVSHGVDQLFLRVNGAKTIEISRPLGLPCEKGGISGEVPCEDAAKRAGAFYAGASENGSKVFFTSTSRVLSGQDMDAFRCKEGTSEERVYGEGEFATKADCESGTPETTDGAWHRFAPNNLYMATIGCTGGLEGEACGSVAEVTSVTLVSHDASPGEAAEVRGVTRVAPDGSHVYFVARGVLSEDGPNGAVTQAKPVEGADNLYVYDSATGKTAFVAELCSGPRESGPVNRGPMADPRCPATLDTSEQNGVNDTRLFRGIPEAQTAGTDGRFLVFSSYGQLTPDDVNSVKDVYRYDAQKESLQRVSLGEGGYGADGNELDVTIGERSNDASIQQQGAQGAKPVARHELASRAVSEDGSRIVFSTARELSRYAKNKLVDVYEWHEGTVALISSGAAEEDDRLPTIAPSGADIFFNTSQGLVPQDTDGARDVYDAHLCTAQSPCFPPVEAQRERCSADACQGPLTNPVPLFVPGSAVQAAGENLPPPAKAKKKAKKKKAKRKRKSRRASARRRGSAHGGARR